MKHDKIYEECNAELNELYEQYSRGEIGKFAHNEKAHEIWLKHRERYGDYNAYNGEIDGLLLGIEVL